MTINPLDLERLYEVYKKHGKIIIGVDFDDTIFALDPRREKMCEAVRTLLKQCSKYAKICLYTVADKHSLKYKVKLMEFWGISPDFVNESPIKLGDGSKPYFNVLLDDKAGLTESYELLNKFISIL